MIPLSSIIHQIFADNIEKYLSVFSPGFEVRKVLNHIVSCRTPELGAAVYGCECGERSFVYHSCRDRHCPICQGINNARWADKQMKASLPVKYFHIVFTLPDILNSFVRNHLKESYSTLFKAASAALLKLSADSKYLGVTPGFTAVLHTWGQTMQFHPHLHVIITAGGLSNNETRFIDKSESQYLFPAKVLSKLFRGIFIDTLDKSVPLPLPLKSSLYQAEFFCYLKEPLECADNVVKYLARYANRVCISESRITAYDKIRSTVTFAYNDNRDGGKQKTMTLATVEFMRRFLLHVLPKRFMKIRHFGLLANRGKYDRINRCRQLLRAAVQCFVSITKNSYQALCKMCGNPIHLVRNMSPVELKAALLC